VEEGLCESTPREEVACSSHMFVMTQQAMCHHVSGERNLLIYFSTHSLFLRGLNTSATGC
jgi:hypothetical protein